MATGAGYDKFCADLAGSSDSIVAAFVISGGRIAGSHIKLNVPALKKEDADRLAMQTKSVMEITKSNERLFGELGYVLVHHESIDGVFFPVGDDATVLAGLVQPYDLAGIAAQVKKMVDRESGSFPKKGAVDSI
ncbi:hypothetical protein [Nitrososphaera sp.]|uniref:hypothetical protein n=1 Tax=Nitrososphaera sp. TaxID=1971748 RepID=UPI00307D9AB1